jgi:hypothetical protein
MAVCIKEPKNIGGVIYLNINQLDALNFIMCLFHGSTCFEQCAHRQEVKTVLYSLWYHHTL